jgi:hypothetical protein
MQAIINSDEMNDYRPNFSDWRVKQRLALVVSWASKNLGMGKKRVHSFKLNAVFGPKGNQLGDWLRNKLLLKAPDRYVPGEKSYAYCVNKTGLRELTKILTRTEESKKQLLDTVQREFETEVKTHEYEYKESSARYWHPLQNLQKDIKDSFWKRNGLLHDYDIECCAPSILVQLAQVGGLGYEKHEMLFSYLKDKGPLRAHVCKLVDCDVGTAKRIINALFNKARLAANPRSAIFKMLDGKHTKMIALQEDPEIKMLRKQVKQMWQFIALKHEGVKTARGRWQLYFAHERRVLDAIISEAKENSIAYFTEHDGIRTSTELDTAAVEKRILQDTGFALKLKKNLEAK